MESASDIERNRRIIAISQLVSSFFDTEEEAEEPESFIHTDTLAPNATTSSNQDEPQE